MLLARGLLAVAIMSCGAVILARMLGSLREGGFAILPGVVLGAAMIALGAHRLSLILRARAMTK
jgi:hypothetical protein